jgi:hypothetical protein
MRHDGGEIMGIPIAHKEGYTTKGHQLREVMQHGLGHGQGAFPNLHAQQQFGLRIDGGPHPVRGARELCRKIAFSRQNPKNVYWKIKDLRVQTFLFSVICDRALGRPRLDKAIEDLVVRMARENRSWGYDRIVGAVKNLGYSISDQTVGNILKRRGIPPAPERKKTVPWREFIRCHLDVLLATDFFTGAVWSCFGLAISFLLCVIHYG